jgi:cytochrome c
MQLLFKKVFLSSLLLLSVQQVQAADPAEALAKKSNCQMCHSVDAAILGPSYKNVAKKYKDEKTAEARLISKVKAGGAGVWGQMPMPASSPQVKDEDIKTIVKWILTLN